MRAAPARIVASRRRRGVRVPARAAFVFVFRVCFDQGPCVAHVARRGSPRDVRTRSVATARRVVGGCVMQASERTAVGSACVDRGGEEWVQAGARCA
ncbi:hypothetical protein PsYK624_007190 [Phanerochaete sordida]|uniref:Uncharacterized protein n=1 Tax=Phanerochaete sordida TaxID=48140 RepID=A0A9P3L859_9APHY|nr:hypothetical protein PsYK624_007190 [Phanerochaete sordida]